MPAATWVDTPAALDDLLAVLAPLDRWAFDTEFHREKTYFPHLALLQIAWEDGIALVDPLAVDVAPLAALLAGDGLVIAHAAEQDLEVLDLACGRGPARLWDTQLAAGFLGLSSPSLSSLVERYVGERLPKADRLTDWSRRPSPPTRWAYAASDVAHLLHLHDVITAALEARGRVTWADEECELLLHRARGAQDPLTAWWRLKDTRSLKGPSRGVAQELTAWRERRAAQLDVPPRYVLPDLAVLGIAHRPPKDAIALSEVRGLDARSIKGQIADQILEAVGRGRDLPASELRLPVLEDTDRDLRPAVALAAAWVAQLGRDEHIDPSLLATRHDLTALLNDSGRSRLTEGWRKGLVGEPVQMLADGGAALAFDGKGGLLLETRSYLPLATDGAPVLPG